MEQSTSGLSGLMNITNSEFKKIRDLVYNQFGINLGETKKSLVIGRLQKILKNGGFDTFEQYYNHVISDKTGESLSVLVDRISTNHTFFYRENEHFDYFRETVLPDIEKNRLSSRSKEIRLWCAACSSGEEPYFLAMLFYEYFKKDINSWNIKILATDISTKALSKANEGIYKTDNISHLPANFKNKYFDKLNEDEYSVKRVIRDFIVFKRLNLMRESFPFNKKFHTIFCRNVMIYFDQPTRDTLVAKFHDNMVDNSYLFIGHSESLNRDSKLFRYLKPSVYAIIPR